MEKEKCESCKKILKKKEIENNRFCISLWEFTFCDKCNKEVTKVIKFAENNFKEYKDRKDWKKFSLYFKIQEWMILEYIFMKSFRKDWEEILFKDLKRKFKQKKEVRNSSQP